MTMAYHRYHGVDTRIVRIFNTYGPRMRPRDGRVVSNFIVQALRGEPLTVYGDGSQTRSFCYVDDEVEGIFRLFMRGDDQPTNIGNPDEFTVSSSRRRSSASPSRHRRSSRMPLPDRRSQSPPAGHHPGPPAARLGAEGAAHRRGGGRGRRGGPGARGRAARAAPGGAARGGPPRRGGPAPRHRGVPAGIPAQEPHDE